MKRIQTKVQRKNTRKIDLERHPAHVELQQRELNLEIDITCTHSCDVFFWKYFTNARKLTEGRVDSLMEIHWQN